MAGNREGNGHSVRVINGLKYIAAEDSMMDVPETPAPTFVLRAFKHLIFGTPKPNDNERDTLKSMDSPEPRPKRDKPGAIASHPVLPRTQSKNGSLSRSQPTKQILESPVKRPGILLTPGTVGTRRKTVSFDGRHAAKENEHALRPNTLASLFDFPGVTELEEAGKATQMTRTLLDIRNTKDGAEHDPARGPLPRNSDSEDITVDISAPRSTSGRYWKSEYDSFSSKSTAEVRKLVKKEKLAKKFAKDKDSEALSFAKELRQEQRKVAKLEEQVAEYARQLSAFTEKDGNRLVGGIEDAKHGSEMGDTKKPTSNSSPTSTAFRDTERLVQEAERRTQLLQEENEKLHANLTRISNAYELVLEQLRNIKHDSCESQVKLEKTTRRMPTPLRLKLEKQEPESDIWADAGIDEDKSSNKSRDNLELSARSPLRVRSVNAVVGVEDRTHVEELQRKQSGKPLPGGSTRTSIATWDQLSTTGKEQVAQMSITQERQEAARTRIAERQKRRNACPEL